MQIPLFAPLLDILYPQFTAKASVSISSISSEHWSLFNSSIHGRLHADGAPFARACFPGGDTDRCPEIQKNYRDGSFRLGGIGSFTNPQWETCQATGKGCLLDFRDPTNQEALTQECHQGSTAKYYVDVREWEDISASFKFASATGVRLVVRNTGHDYIGRSAAPESLTISTRNLQGMSYNPEFQPDGCKWSAPSVTMGAGTVFGQLYPFAEENGITIVGATDRTVGASGGWVQGGGHGLLSPTMGLGVDRVVQYKVVTPTGHFLIANACQNTDLFFALRGGGGGTFGVVVESTFRVEPRPTPLQVVKVVFPANDENWIAAIRIGVQNMVRWSEEAWSGLINTGSVLFINPKLSSSEAEESFKPLVDFAKSLNGTVIFKHSPTWLSFFDEFITGNPVGYPGAPSSRIVPKEHFLTPESQEALIHAIIAGSTKSHFKQILISNPVHFQDDGSTSVTPAWRTGLWNVVFGNFWNHDASVSGIQAAYSASTEAIRPLKELTVNGGAYHAEADVYEHNHEASFWGDNYPRLLAIKNKYDPQHLLDCWHCVGWKGPLDERYSCMI